MWCRGLPTGVLFSHQRDSEAIARIMVQHSLKSPFFLFVGLAHKRKRLDWLFSVLARLKAERGLCPPLVMVGDYGAYQGELEWLVVANDLGSQVRFLGRVDDDELANLYHGAVALVISSVDEGFCLPAVGGVGLRNGSHCPRYSDNERGSRGAGAVLRTRRCRFADEAIGRSLYGWFPAPRDVGPTSV